MRAMPSISVLQTLDVWRSDCVAVYSIRNNFPGRRPSDAERSTERCGALGPVAAQERRHRVERATRGRQVFRRVLEDVVQPFEDIEMHLAPLDRGRRGTAPRVVEQYLVAAHL